MGKNDSVFRLGEILIQSKGVTWEQMQEALRIQRESGKLIGDILVEKGYVTLTNLYRALAEQSNMTFVELDKLSIPPEVIKMVPKNKAYEFNIMPLVAKDGIFLLAISDPRNVEPELELRKLHADYELRWALATPPDIEKHLRKYYGPQK